MKSQKMTKERFIEWALSQGWHRDNYGHLQKAVAGTTLGDSTTVMRQYRYKLSRIAVRREIKTPSGWMRLESGYFSQLSIGDTGVIIGMSR